MNGHNNNRAGRKNAIFSIQREAAFIAFFYGALGFLWILLSDELLLVLFPAPADYRLMQTYKGWVYVALTSALLYLLVRGRLLAIQEAYSREQRVQNHLSQTERELDYQKTLKEALVSAAPVVVMTWDGIGRIHSVNEYGCQLLGCSPDDQPKDWEAILYDSQQSSMVEEISLRLQKHLAVPSFEIPLRDETGKRLEMLWNSSLLPRQHGGLTEMVSVGVEIGAQKRYEEQLEQAAYVDSLTGLHNRLWFEDHSSQWLRSWGDNRVCALVHLDMDNFRHINDSLSYQAGDLFLQYLGNLLQETVQAPNLLARISGDAFEFFLVDIQDPVEVEARLNQLRERLGNTWNLHNHRFRISFSAGVAFYPKNGEEFTDLFKRAEMAMTVAKREGKAQTVFYRNGLQDRNMRKIEMAARIQHGLDQREFILHYQPKFELESGRMIGMEALVRWQDSLGRIVPPGEFIGLAEETGQIYAIEKQVMAMALAFRKELEHQGRTELDVAVNLSGKTLSSAHHFSELLSIIDNSPVDLSQLVIEITETAVITDVERAIAQLNLLRDRGIRIALDDFGTGFSSLTYLKSLPIQSVKLDRSFVEQIEMEEKDRRIIASVLELAQSLGYEVVAEGIETQAQLSYLKSHGCDSGQGYLLGRPVPKEQLEQEGFAPADFHIER